VLPERPEDGLGDRAAAESAVVQQEQLDLTAWRELAPSVCAERERYRASSKVRRGHERRDERVDTLRASTCGLDTRSLTR
jgi:hypothetical protein